MRSALSLVMGIVIGAGAATLAGQQRDIVSLNHVAIAVAHAPDGTTIELMEFGPDSLHRKVMNDWKR